MAMSFGNKLAAGAVFAAGLTAANVAQAECRDVITIDAFGNKIVEVACPAGEIPSGGGLYIGRWKTGQAAPMPPVAPPAQAEKYPDAANEENIIPAACVAIFTQLNAAADGIINALNTFGYNGFNCRQLDDSLINMFRMNFSACVGYEQYLQDQQVQYSDKVSKAYEQHCSNQPTPPPARQNQETDQ